MMADTSGDAAAAPGKKTKRPENSDFKQQKLKAWQPVLTASSVLPTFFVVGLAFLPISIGLFFSSSSVQEHQVEYTNCTSKDAGTAGSDCGELLEAAKQEAVDKNQTLDHLTCSCEKRFDLNENFSSNVFLYYKLTNFYQNHRRYVKSRDDKQLSGKLPPSEVPDESCAPFRELDGVPIAPCGAVANSLFNFNDTLKLYRCLTDDCTNKIPVPVEKNKIAWPTDKSTKFQNPPVASGATLKDAFNGSARPPFWSKDIWELDTVTPNDANNGYQNEDFIVWMRTAALPNFRKLYRRVNHEDKDGNPFKDGLPAGKYLVEIDYNYPVISFDGTKTLILANTSWMGGKNNFLAIAYFVVSLICLILGVVFLIIHIKMPMPTNNQSGAGSAEAERH